MPAPAGRPEPSSEPSAPPFLLSIDLAKGRVSLHGDLDRQQVHRLLEAVDVLRHSPAPSLLVDTSALTFCNTAGLHGLISARRLAQQSGRELRIEGARPLLRRLMCAIGLPTG